MCLEKPGNQEAKMYIICRLHGNVMALPGAFFMAVLWHCHVTAAYHDVAMAMP